MRPIRDPEGAELRHLASACELTGKTILEIGCGDGKFTRQYAGASKKIIGIDPEITDLRTAKNDMNTSEYHSFFIQSMGERLPFPSQSFNIAIFACSL